MFGSPEPENELSSQRIGALRRVRFFRIHGEERIAHQTPEDTTDSEHDGEWFHRAGIRSEVMRTETFINIPKICMTSQITGESQRPEQSGRAHFRTSMRLRSLNVVIPVSDLQT